LHLPQVLVADTAYTSNPLPMNFDNHRDHRRGTYALIEINKPRQWAWQIQGTADLSQIHYGGSNLGKVANIGENHGQLQSFEEEGFIKL
jgi:predicted ATP-grasp superfamily ATP-dependent carboligase